MGLFKSMKIKLRLFADIVEVDGKVNLKFRNPAYYFQQLQQMKGKKRAIITVESEGRNRSDQQNKYLWAVIYPILAEATGYTVEEIHEYAKATFLPPKIIRVAKKAIYVTPSTTQLSTSDMVEYIDKLIQLANELGCTVPTPEDAGYKIYQQPPYSHDVP